MLWVLITIACCGYSLELPQRGGSNEYPQHMFLWRNKQNYPLIITKYPPYLFYWRWTSGPTWWLCMHVWRITNCMKLWSLFSWDNSFEPSYEIMVLFVLRKLILQTRMHNHSVGLDAWFLAGPFVYFHTKCVRTAKAVVRLCGCAGSPELSLVAYVISTKISWAGSFISLQIMILTTTSASTIRRGWATPGYHSPIRSSMGMSCQSHCGWGLPNQGQLGHTSQCSLGEFLD